MLHKSVVGPLDSFLKSGIGLLLLVGKRKEVGYLVLKFLIFESLLVDFLGLLGDALVVEEMAHPFVLNHILIVFLLNIIGDALLVRCDYLHFLVHVPSILYLQDVKEG